jgi:hypothetical protein
MEEGESVSKNLFEFVSADLRKAVRSPEEVDASHSSRESSAAVAVFFVATSYKYLSLETARKFDVQSNGICISKY